MPLPDTFDDRLEALLDQYDDLRAKGLNPRVDELTTDPRLRSALIHEVTELLQVDAVLGGRSLREEPPRRSACRRATSR